MLGFRGSRERDGGRLTPLTPLCALEPVDGVYWSPLEQYLQKICFICFVSVLFYCCNPVFFVNKQLLFRIGRFWISWRLWGSGEHDLKIKEWINLYRYSGSADWTRWCSLERSRTRPGAPLSWWCQSRHWSQPPSLCLHTASPCNRSTSARVKALLCVMVKYSCAGLDLDLILDIM